MNAMLENAIAHWKYVVPLVAPPKNEAGFEQLISHLDALSDRVGEDEHHSLIRLVDIMSDAVSAYEAKHLQEPMGKVIDALCYLMKAHGLRQTDLPEIGSQVVVSEILNGRRELNLCKIKALTVRFKLSPATFID